MKAVCYNQYGGPEKLFLKEVPRPSVKPDQVLIKVKAASINSWDYDMLRGNALIIRLLSGLRNPKYSILGSDVAGVVAAVGSACTDWKPGDEVFGDIASAGFGSFAEYVAVPGELLARKPKAISFQDAAALPQAGLLAIQGLRQNGEIKAGQHILINGAGGGVGPIALTYAKSLGAKVTCVDRKEKFEMLKAFGADELIDFTTTDYTRTGHQYDRILDVVAHRSAADYRRALSANGIFTMIGGSMSGLLLRMMLVEPLIAKFQSKKMGIMGYRVTRNGLEELAQLFQTQTIKVAIDKTFSLANLREAFEYFESGNFKGKIVVQVD